MLPDQSSFNFRFTIALWFLFFNQTLIENFRADPDLLFQSRLWLKINFHILEEKDILFSDLRTLCSRVSIGCTRPSPRTAFDAPTYRSSHVDKWEVFLLGWIVRTVFRRLHIWFLAKIPFFQTSRKNKPHIRILAGFASPYGTNQIAKKTSI